MFREIKDYSPAMNAVFITDGQDCAWAILICHSDQTCEWKAYLGGSDRHKVYFKPTHFMEIDVKIT